ncbi:MAG: hypothetical protein CL677_09065 [Bdellovibrionaceae bacterium]|nr:hypothetical protein [Pseudobdellovibrionaceae bacterium]
MKSISIFLFSIFSLTIWGATSSDASVQPQAPVAQRISHVNDFHNDPRVDWYSWMHEPTNPDVLGHLEQENTFADSYMSRYESRQTDFLQKLQQLRTHSSVVLLSFASGFIEIRWEAGESYGKWFFVNRETRSERLIFDENTASDGHDFFQVMAAKATPDEKSLVLAIDTVGRGRPHLALLNLEAGQLRDLPMTVIPSLASHGSEIGMIWLNDDSFLFLGQVDEMASPHLYRYSLEAGAETLLHTFSDELDGHFKELYKSVDGTKFLVNLMTTQENQVHSIDPIDFSVTVVMPEEVGVISSLNSIGGQWYRRSNKNFEGRLIEKKVGAEWVEIYRPVSGELMDVAWGDTHLVLVRSFGGMSELSTLDLVTQEHVVVQVDQELVSFQNLLIDKISGDLYYRMQTYTDPRRTYRVRLGESHPVALMGEAENRSGYTTRRLFAPARDGVQVPITLMHAVDDDLSVNKPLYLIGYGSYGHYLAPKFKRAHRILVDSGVRVAWAHIRGGGINGSSWYDQGRVFNKMNTFNDFIDSAEYLFAEGITSSQKLAIGGRSAGGLLIGAVINMRPDLARVASAGVPFVDVLNTMTLYYDPLARFEKQEWGDGLVEDQYFNIKSWDPYTNVTTQDYPSLYVFTGFEDTAVYYFQPAKWVAKIRHFNPNPLNPVLFTTTFDAGHGGGSGIDAGEREVAREFSFILGELER